MMTNQGEFEPDYSNCSTEQLMMLNIICSLSGFPEDKELRKRVLEELNARLKKDPNIQIDLSQFMEK